MNTSTLYMSSRESRESLRRRFVDTLDGHISYSDCCARDSTVLPSSNGAASVAAIKENALASFANAPITTCRCHDDRREPAGDNAHVRSCARCTLSPSLRGSEGGRVEEEGE
ncbi:hypothetical protein MTO96_005692 [Rhipicephalus appendiculatus]